MILALCELYNPMLHGGENTYMKNKYLISFTFTPDEFYNNEHITVMTLINAAYRSIMRLTSNINIDYSNYNEIINNPKYYQLHIIDEEELETGELTGILKTYNIAILQRKWKKIYAKRKKIIKLRKSPKALQYRQIYGKWSSCCSTYV